MTDKPTTPPAGEPTETIVAAAIRMGVIVLTGPHHHQIIRYTAPLLNIRPVNGEQGFVTSLGRFVSRELAAHIAFVAGQLKEQQSTLFSEQLWEIRDDVFVGGALSEAQSKLAEADGWRKNIHDQLIAAERERDAALSRVARCHRLLRDVDFGRNDKLSFRLWDEIRNELTAPPVVPE